MSLAAPGTEPTLSCSRSQAPVMTVKTFAEIVRDASRQAAHRFHLLRLPQLIVAFA